MKKKPQVTKKVESEIKKILKRDGVVTPSAVVNQARDPENPLHPRFEWDDTKCGEQYRLLQARNLIRKITFVYKEGGEDRLIHVPSVVKSEGHYQLGSVLVRNVDEYDRAFAEASRKLEAAERAVDDLRRIAGDGDGDRIATLAFVRESMANARVALERIH